MTSQIAFTTHTAVSDAAALLFPLLDVPPVCHGQNNETASIACSRWPVDCYFFKTWSFSLLCFLQFKTIHHSMISCAINIESNNNNNTFMSIEKAELTEHQWAGPGLPANIDLTHLEPPHKITLPCEEHVSICEIFALKVPYHRVRLVPSTAQIYIDILLLWIHLHSNRCQNKERWNRSINLLPWPTIIPYVA